ncbi:hypothetical protein NDGK_02856 [Clostridiales bacterium CHKCI001]|nr:hypothetical protein NDGK_02856 [Clostridiales bacterium CHKCI001]
MPFVSEFIFEAVRAIFLGAVIVVAVIGGKKFRDYKDAKKA